MPCALRNAPANGARTMAKNEYLAKALTLLSLGTPSKQYLRPIAAISTSTVLPGMNQAIELSGTPACRSARANPTKDAGISNGQTLTRTNNNPTTRIAHPGQSGNTVWGFEISTPARVGMRYDNAAVTHTTSNVARKSRYGWLREMRLWAIVMTMPLASRNSVRHLASVGGIAKVSNAGNHVRMLRANFGARNKCQPVPKCIGWIRTTKVEGTCQGKFIPQLLQPNSSLVPLL